jgi:hypothetical protein
MTMGDTAFGFLLDDRVFQFDLPTRMRRMPEASSSVGLTPAAALAIQCAPRERDNWLDGWTKGFDVSAGRYPVSVYQRPDDRIQ